MATPGRPKARAGAGQQRLGLGETRTRRAPREYEPFVPGPNPRLAEFIAEHSTPYNPETDRYDVPAFDRDLTVDKAAPPKAIYDMHSYWSKKHWAAIRQYIRHYLPPKLYPRGTGLVLDCFSGSGMTGVAAMMEDRPCVLIDASPAAAFISHCYTHPVDPEVLEAAYERMLTEPYPPELRRKLKEATGEEIPNLRAELNWLYATRCDRCRGEATTEYVVYSERFQCPSCAEVIPLFDCPEVKVPYPVAGRRSGKTELKKKRVCPQCLARSGGKPSREFAISTRSRKFGAVPVLTRYRCLGACQPAVAERRHNADRRTREGRYFQDHDLIKLKGIEQAENPHWYPQRKMMDVEDDSRPWGMEWRPGRDFRSIAQLYTRRNLWALAAWLAALSRMRQASASVEALQLAFTGVCMGLSRMNRYRPNVTFPLNVMTGTYYLPQISAEAAVIPHISNKVTKIEHSHAALVDAMPLGAAAVVSSEAAIPGSALAESCLDYVFTDPAYVDKVQYGELNFVWESWLGFSGDWLKDEIVVNPFRDKAIDDWDRDLRAVLANLYRALKPARWLSLCYHDTDPGTWARLQNMLLDTGFEIHTVTVLDPKQKSSNQLTAEKVVKGDLVVNCRKPRPGEDSRSGEGEAGLVSQRVREILIETLSHTGGQTRDRLWDTVLKRLLTRGQLAEHRFDDLLGEVAFRSESGRWFLKEEYEQLSASDLKNEEQAGDALVRFARLRMTGTPAALAARLVLEAPALSSTEVDEDAVERYVRSKVAGAEDFSLGARLKGVEFYDCLFFYLTRWLKGRGSGKTPRRNLAEFLDEYLVRFKEGDRWLYRVPDAAEAESLKKARQTGLGRRIRQFVAFLNGEGDYPRERLPDARTLVGWLKHCAAFGLAEEGVALFEKSGLAAQLSHLGEDDRYDAEDYYARCRRRAGRRGEEEAEEDDGDTDTDADES